MSEHKDNLPETEETKVLPAINEENTNQDPMDPNISPAETVPFPAVEEDDSASEDNTESPTNEDSENQAEGAENEEAETTSGQTPEEDKAPHATPESKSDHNHFSIGLKPILVFIALLCVIAAVFACIGFGMTLSQHTQQQTPAQIIVDDGANNTDTASESASAEHQHTWTPNYEIQTIEAKTHTVHHDATYKTITEEHTLCNVCFEQIDGRVQEHMNNTGHSGATPNVPIEVQVIDQPAWDEVVVDEPEHQELITNGEICADCGETRNVSE